MPRNDETRESCGRVVELKPRRRAVIQLQVDAGAWEAFVAAALTLGATDVAAPIAEARSIEATPAGEADEAARPVHLRRLK
jgi:hypothetical protein